MCLWIKGRVQKVIQTDWESSGLQPDQQGCQYEPPDRPAVIPGAVRKLRENILFSIINRGWAVDEKEFEEIFQRLEKGQMKSGQKMDCPSPRDRLAPLWGDVYEG